MFICTTGGKPIAEAKVKVKGLDQEWLSGKDGKVNLKLTQAFIDGLPQESRTIDTGTGTSTTEQVRVLEVTCSKRHHGPIAPGVVFANGPLTTKTDLSLATNSYASTAPDVEFVTKETWVQGKKVVLKRPVRLVMRLVEGGTLGKNYYFTSGGYIRARRLTNGTVATDGTVTPGEVQKELLHRIAQGELALSPSTEFEFEHDQSNGEFEPCTSNCKLKVPKKAVGGSAVHKVSVKNETIADVRFLSISMTLMPGRHPTHSVRRVQMTDLNQRLVVAMARLCIRMKTDHNVAAIYTNGFLRYATIITPPLKPTAGELVGDSHGRGRAFDFAGVALTLPPEPELSKGTFFRMRPNVDFIVGPHWGRLFMRVLDAAGVEKYHAEDKKNKNVAGKEMMLYRLDPPPAIVDVSQAKPVVQVDYPFMMDGPPDPKGKPTLIPDEATTTAHLQAAATYFKAVFDFTVNDMSFWDAWLGEQQKQQVLTSTSANDAKAVPAIGTTGGFTVHPDSPTYSERKDHWEHIHMQLGKSSQKGDGTYEQ